MIQQTLHLFDAFPILEVPAEQFQEQIQEHYQERNLTANSSAQATLLEETQQLFHSNGSEAEMVALIQRAIDAIQDLCDQTN